jgi:cytochrome P450
MSIAPSRRAAGPRGYPLIGVFPSARRDPLGFFMECARRYGDVISMRLGPYDAYLLTHPDHVKHVLQDHAHRYAKGPPAARIRGLFGDSLTVLDDDRWRRRRRQLQPAFQSSHHAQFASIVSTATRELLERWRRLADARAPVDAVTEMRRLTQTIIIRACLGDMATAEIELARALDVAVGYVDRRLWSAFGWLDVPTPAAVRYRRALGAIDARIADTISDARAPLTLGKPSTDAELRHELKAMLVAGSTTTASALAWTWYVLSERPEIRERLEQECCMVFGGRAPTLEMLPRAGYTRRVIDEVLRLYPPTWLTARVAVEDDSLAGYAIPAGAMVLLSPYVTHRHPAIWQAPDVFDPDRFTPAQAATRPTFAYFPFGGGPRRCIGSAFATTEMQLIVAAVAQRYRLTLLRGVSVTPAAGLTLRPSPGMPAHLDRIGAE